MQQTAILSNGFASRPFDSRLHEPSTMDRERHQIRDNSNLINSILVASVLGKEDIESLNRPSRPRNFSLPIRWSVKQQSTLWIQPPSRSQATMSSPDGSEEHRLRTALRFDRGCLFLSIFFSLVVSARVLRLTDPVSPRMIIFAHGSGFVGAFRSFPAFSHGQRCHADGLMKEAVPVIDGIEGKSLLLHRVRTRLTVPRGRFPLPGPVRP